MVAHGFWCSFIRWEIHVIMYFLLLHFSSSCFLCFAFLSRINIVIMASLLNGMIDILRVFHVLRPWNFSSFISLSSFYFRDLCTDAWLIWRSRRWLETKEIGPKVSFIILAFWYFIIVFVVWFFIVLLSVLAFYRLFLSSVRSTNYWVIWVNLMGWAGRGQCTDLASWPLHKMYMLLLAVSVHVYPDLMLLSCIGWPYFHAQFSLLLSPPSQIVEIFTTSKRPSSRHFPIYAQIPLRLPSSVSQRFLQTKLTQSRN